MMENVSSASYKLETKGRMGKVVNAANDRILKRIEEP
jgi:hypothetical protein